jgi:hypothetical protein
MAYTRLTWILGGLFLVFGLPMLLTGNLAWRQFWAGLSTLCLGGFAVSMAGDSVAAGQVRLQHSVIRYADHPRLFWAAVAGIAATGVAVLGTGIWLLFFKA